MTARVRENRELRGMPGISASTYGALVKVAKERQRQDAKWHRVPGIWPDSTAVKLAVLIEEVGEVGKAIFEQDAARALQAELVQVAAVAVCWAEAIEREVRGG